MTITYVSGPSGTLTGGSSYASQFEGYDKDTWNQGGSNYLEGNWAHSAYEDYSIGNSILSTGTFTFIEAGSSLPGGTMRWEASGTIVNPWDNGAPILAIKYLKVIESDGVGNPTLDDSDCQIVKEWWVQGH